MVSDRRFKVFCIPRTEPRRQDGPEEPAGAAAAESDESRTTLADAKGFLRGCLAKDPRAVEYEPRAGGEDDFRGAAPGASGTIGGRAVADSDRGPARILQRGERSRGAHRWRFALADAERRGPAGNRQQRGFEEFPGHREQAPDITDVHIAEASLASFDQLFSETEPSTALKIWAAMTRSGRRPPNEIHQSAP